MMWVELQCVVEVVALMRSSWDLLRALYTLGFSNTSPIVVLSSHYSRAAYFGIVTDPTRH